MKILCLIPARMNSSRFPGKPMHIINGKPMIQHVYERCIQSPLLTEVYVATCDFEISEHIESIGGNSIMTSQTHERASDRCGEALGILESKGKQFDIVLMVQGDEPLVNKSMIEQSLQPILNNKDINVVNLFSEINSLDEFNNPNTIKVALDQKSRALYFSRMPIPTAGKSARQVYGYKQVCIIPFRRDSLLMYINTKPTENEIRESVDMMRILDTGGFIQMIKTDAKTHPVDVFEDINIVKKLMEDDHDECI